jgi:NADPH-dependent curcumin reductase CurA
MRSASDCSRSAREDALMNRRIVLAARPAGMVDDRTTRLEETPVPEPGPGQALVRVTHLSIDPTIRGWMRDRETYVPPIAIGEVIRSAALGEVVESNVESLKPGDVVFGVFGWQDYALVDNSAQVVPPGIAPETALGVLGVTGLTAYFGLVDVGNVKEGDVVVVSGAAGATGSVAGQVAKILGAKTVVGIAGSPEKCAWLLGTAGFDHAINYRTENIAARLREACPDGIDLYWDNVGGPILNTCLAQLAMRGRVVLCGAISQYNDAEPPPGPANYLNLLVKRGRMEGFIILDYFDRFPEGQAQLFEWVATGRIHTAEQIVDGLEHAPDALNMLFTGANLGKVIVRLAT